tara:strand:+ start:3814 stop:4344 length:531 start_codon:yes stop_codon:yes gene_type:complete
MTELERKIGVMVGREIEYDYQMQGKEVDGTILMKQSQAIGVELVATYKDIQAQHLADIFPLVRRMYSFINFHNLNRTLQSSEWTQLKSELFKQRQPKALPNQNLTDIATPLYTSIANMLFERVRRPFSDFGNMVDYEKYYEDSGVFKMANKVCNEMMLEGADKDTPIKEIDERFLR